MSLQVSDERRRWVPGGWFQRSRWDVVAVTRTEADIIARLKEHSTPHRETTKFYDKHGGEDVGDGW